MAVGAQQIAVVDAGAGEGPMVGPVNGEAPHAARRATAPSGIKSIGGIQTEGLGPGPPRLACLPGAGGARRVGRAVARIPGARPIFISNLRFAASFQPRL